MVLTDWELLEQWRQGDKNAGTQLVGRHYPLISRFFANKVTIKHEAQDLTQETFKACIERKDHIRGDAFRSYLFGIAVNLLRRYIHRKTHRPVESLDLADVKVLDYSLPSMTSIMTRRREEALLVAALRELSIDQQIVQELTLFDELNAREIAELLDVPEGTVRSRLRLAREYLASRLRTPGSGGEPEGSPTSLETWARAIRKIIDEGSGD